MGRPRSFETGPVLDAILDVFWERGFDGASVGDLAEATGLQKGSIYNAFGGKRELFLAALDRYLETVEAGLAERIEQARQEAGSAGGAVDLVLAGFASSPRSKLAKRGCFALNTSAAGSCGDAQVKARVVGHFQRITAALAGPIGEAQREEAVRNDLDAEILACLVFSTLAGHRVTGRCGAAGLDPTGQLDALRAMMRA